MQNPNQNTQKGKNFMLPKGIGIRREFIYIFFVIHIQGDEISQAVTRTVKRL